MKKLEYQVSFTTPAFLGNAEQSGQWRTPPFKALLRQWWRVAYATERRFAVRVDEMRHEEGVLFGHAWLNDDHDAHGQKIAARKSLVRMRLDSWGEGKLSAREWQPLATVAHPEVRSPVCSDLYLGYGPVTLPRGERQPKLKANAAIQSGESAKLSLAVPDEHASRIERALGLMASYGTLGGRSRNGWGSLALIPGNGTPAFSEAPDRRLFCDWKDALSLDWPHCIGTTEGAPLIWETSPMADWKAVMKRLAQIKIGLRTQFKFPNAQPPHPAPLPRHWLSYPITRHTTRAWDRNARLPNSLRFKVRQGADGKLRGVIFHVPCLPPAQFRPDVNAIQKVWREVHAYLDAAPQQLTRIPA